MVFYRASGGLWTPPAKIDSDIAVTKNTNVRVEAAGDGSYLMATSIYGGDKDSQMADGSASSGNVVLGYVTYDSIANKPQTAGSSTGRSGCSWKIQTAPAGNWIYNSALNTNTSSTDTYLPSYSVYYLGSNTVTPELIGIVTNQSVDTIKNKYVYSNNGYSSKFVRSSNAASSSDYGIKGNIFTGVSITDCTREVLCVIIGGISTNRNIDANGNISFVNTSYKGIDGTVSIFVPSGTPYSSYEDRSVRNLIVAFYKFNQNISNIGIGIGSANYATAHLLKLKYN